MLWRPEVSSYVLPLRSEPRAADFGSGLAFTRLRAHAAAVMHDGSTQHVLFADRDRRLQIAVRGGDLFTSGGVFTEIPDPRHLDRRLTLLRRLGRLLAHGELEPERGGSVRRLTVVLRALDGTLAGASQRQIAAALFNDPQLDREWRLPGSVARDRVQRAIRRGVWLMHGGYLTLLR